jgi:hypothetical protein
MTSAADPDGTDLSTLKGRRKARAARRSQTPPTDIVELPPLPDAHKSMTAALRRPAGLAVLHPLERGRLAVVEIGGHVPAANLAEHYVVAEFDASEQHTPWGCRTPITRQLWTKGQHVRRDVYATYLATHPELDPDRVDETDPEDDGEPDTDGGLPPAADTEVEAGAGTERGEAGADGVAATTPPAAV